VHISLNLEGKRRWIQRRKEERHKEGRFDPEWDEDANPSRLGVEAKSRGETSSGSSRREKRQLKKKGTLMK